MNKQRHRGRFFQTALVVGFVVTLITANLTATKLTVYDFPLIGSYTGSVAAFMIGISFLFSDVLCELYGKKYAQIVVNSSIVGVCGAFILVTIAVNMQPAASFSLDSEFKAVFAASYPILIASVLSLLISQNIDVLVFDFLKRMSDGRAKWMRNLCSTGVSQLLDTAIFSVLAFGVLPVVFQQPRLSWGVIGSIILAEYIIKLCVALLDTPAFYIFTWCGEWLNVGRGEINGG